MPVIENSLVGDRFIVKSTRKSFGECQGEVVDECCNHRVNRILVKVHRFNQEKQFIWFSKESLTALFSLETLSLHRG